MAHLTGTHATAGMGHQRERTAACVFENVMETEINDPFAGYGKLHDLARNRHDGHKRQQKTWHKSQTVGWHN